MLENDHIKLRAVEPEDLPLLYEWENDMAWWAVGNNLNPYSKFALRQYIEEAQKTIYETRQLRLMISLKPSGETVGMIDLYEFDPHHSRAGVGLLVGREHQQRGYAAQALRLLTDYAFGFLHLKTLFAHVNADNEASLALFGKAGFQHAGVLKNWLRVGDGYCDVVIYIMN